MEILVEKDPNDSKDIFLEIRAGSGGDEAAIFAGDLYKMYCKFVEKNKWSMELMNVNEGDHGGYKEIILKVIGNEVYSKLKFESGTHSAFNSSGGPIIPGNKILTYYVDNKEPHSKTAKSTYPTKS